MKFTTRQLLILPLVFIVNTWLLYEYALPKLRNFSWQREMNQVSEAQRLIASAARAC